MTQNAGGSATNSGINYQNRCAAYYLAMMLSNSTESDSIGIKPIDIVRVAFEANCPIDDFVVETTDAIFYFQAKRSIFESSKFVYCSVPSDNVFWISR